MERAIAEEQGDVVRPTILTAGGWRTEFPPAICMSDFHTGRIPLPQFLVE